MLLFPLLLCGCPVGVGGVGEGEDTVPGLELKLGICTVYLNYITEVDMILKGG